MLIPKGDAAIGTTFGSVMFDEPVLLEAGVKYHLVSKLSGGNGYYGNSVCFPYLFVDFELCESFFAFSISFFLFVSRIY